MKKTAALFSGQGSQYPGMGRALFEEFEEARQVYRCGGDILGFDIAKVSFQGSEEELSRTAVAQPAIFALSMAAYRCAMSFLPEPYGVAGHSLGEYAALCAAGAYSLEDGFRIIKARARVMEEAARSASGAMAAVIGSSEETVARVCRETEGFVEPVNYNLPKQTVISGEEAAVLAAAEVLSGLGARTVRLSVSSAFHTRMMQAAADRLRDEIKDIAFRRISCVFYSNLTGGALEPEDYPDYFARHMVSPVKFVNEVASLVADGAECCIEYGPGKSAGTLAKKNARALAVFNVESPETLRLLREETV